MKNDFYTKGPTNIPETLTKPSKSFKKRVFFAFAGLLIFAVAYIGLMVWFAMQSITLIQLIGKGTENNVFLIIMVICFAVLSIFMFKALFIFNKKRDNQDREITAENEPLLVDFIHKVAEETGAPKPKKIYLSHRVNACVFYDISFINILIPSKKNLEIGLGLVNVLNMSEFKAILAHEFGHFAQKSMLLGRYVYVAQQIASKIVNGRDALDRGLALLASIDLRVAWIGWILMILVWAIRGFIEVLFGIVVISERALSKEMEFQADRVAVSVTGSDALIYALHKLKAADEGFHSGLSVVEEVLRDKKAVPDLFALQTNYITQMRRVLGDENFGRRPKNAVQEKSYRLFNNQLINPPEMWATHPSDMDREKNAKENYVLDTIDERSPLELFTNAKALFEDVTATLIKTAEAETEEVLSMEESVQIMNDNKFNWTFLNPKYNGVYLYRNPFSCCKDVSEIYDAAVADNLAEEFDTLYPDLIREDLDLHRELVEEVNLLSSAMNEIRTGEKRKIVHRGNEVPRKKLPEIIAELEKDEKIIRLKLIEHDKRCRKIHFEAAKKIHPTYSEYHYSLASLLHFTEHTGNHLNDLNARLQHTLFVVLADGRVSDSELVKVQEDARALHKAMAKTYHSVTDMKLDPELLAQLGVKESKDLFGEEYKFAFPDHENIESWINNYGGWLGVILHGVNKLRNGALERLLVFEESIKVAHSKGIDPEIKGGKFIVGNDFERSIPGEERKAGVKLRFWDKFQAGIGLFPTIVKFTAAAAIIFAAIFAGTVDKVSELYIHNGLGVDVELSINGKHYYVEAISDLMIEISGDASISAKTIRGEFIDSFKEEIDAFEKYVYNIGYGSYLTSYEVDYDGFSEPISMPIGAVRWMRIDADYIFEEAPESLYLERGERTSRIVLTAVTPDEMVYLPEDEWTNKDVRKMILAHLDWDAENDISIGHWLNIASILDDNYDLAKYRIGRYPHDVESFRYLQDHQDETKRDETNALLDASFEDKMGPDYLYLKTRNMEDGTEQDSLFVQHFRKWKTNSWLARAAGYVYSADGKWKQSGEAYEVAARSSRNADVATELYKINLLRRNLGDLNAPELILSDDVKYQLAIENADEDYNLGANIFFYHLHNDQYQQAISVVNSVSIEEQLTMNWFLAASTGADEAVVNQALDSDLSNSINSNNIAIAVGLLAKNDRDYSKALDLFQEIYGLDEGQMENIRAFVLELKEDRVSNAERYLGNFESYHINALCELIGVIILEEKAPDNWRIEIESLLFVTEKPYLANPE